MLNKKELLGALALKRGIVKLPEGDVLITEMSANDYLEMCNLSKVEGQEPDEKGAIQLDMKKFNPAILVYCVVDEEGKRIFDEDDMEFLAAKTAQGPFMKIVQKAKELNGLMGDEGNDLELTKIDSSDGE